LTTCISEWLTDEVTETGDDDDLYGVYVVEDEYDDPPLEDPPLDPPPLDPPYPLEDPPLEDPPVALLSLLE